MVDERVRAALARAQPVRRIPGDPERDEPEDGIALCLSGGGFRAMLFHLGALWRLNELGYLARLERVSSVSGGSISAGQLGLAWRQLSFDTAGVARRFSEEVVAPIRRLAGKTLDQRSILGGIVLPGSSIAEKVAQAYGEHLFGSRTLQDLPDRPRFVLNATNLQSGVLWRFSKPYLWDYRVGKIERPRTPVAVAVAASAAFPPFLSPLVLEFSDRDFLPGTGDDLQRPPFTTRVYLSDGGVYDNLGLETAWKRYRTILVSDGGGQMEPEPEPKRDWPRQAHRVLSVVDNQVRSLRKRQVIASYQGGLRDGAYWGIRSHIADYGVADALPCPVPATTRLADVPTRLAALDASLQKQLVNWGYAIADAALRAHVDPRHPPAQGFPHPDVGVG